LPRSASAASRHLVLNAPEHLSVIRTGFQRQRHLNRATKDNPLYKKDHAQLLQAEPWFKEKYPGRDAVRVSALPEPVANVKATPAGTYALRLEEATKLAGAARELLVDLTTAPGDEAVLQVHCETHLTKANLTPNGIKASYLKPFKI
jgi:hypothetical protein